MKILTAAGTLIVLAMLAAGCGYKIVLSPEGRPIDPGQTAELLEKYNSAPKAARISGKLRAKGRGRASFGASVAEGAGLRLDAVGGPFSTPMLAIACKSDQQCQVFLPSSRKMYLDLETNLDKWLGAVVRGRTPVLGKAARARTLPDGTRILTLVGETAWSQEIEFPPNAEAPSRTVYLKDGRPEVELLFSDLSTVGGRPFPMRVIINVREPRERYEIEIEKASQWTEVNEKIFTLAVPPGVSVERVRRDSNWKNQQLPLWIQPPG